MGHPQQEGHRTTVVGSGENDPLERPVGHCIGSTREAESGAAHARLGRRLACRGIDQMK